MRALVLGGHGFIGSHLVARLRRDGVAVENMGEPDYDLASADWVAFEPWEDYTHVFLLAARLGVSAVEAAPYETLDTNVRIVQNVLRWLPNKGERLIFASSSEVYGMSVARGLAPVPTPEDIPLCADVAAPRGAYALSKMFGEAAVRHAHRNWTLIRYHNVYGPGQRRGVIYDLWQRGHASPFYLPGATNTRSFCYIDDAVEATLRLAACGEAAGQVVNVGNPEEVTILELAQRFLGPGRYFPRPAPEGSPKRRCPDITRLTTLTGYRPQVMLAEGLERTRAWLKTQDDPVTATLPKP